MKAEKTELVQVGEKMMTRHEHRRYYPKAATRRHAKEGSPKTVRNVTRGKLGSICGHSVISVIRAMGRANWDFEKAQTALKKQGIRAAIRTIRGALRRGQLGQKKIAPISAKELAALKPKHCR